MPVSIDTTAMPPLARDFASYKTLIQGCSEKTVTEYMLDLRMFSRYISAKRAGNEITDEAMESCDISRLDVDFYKNITTEEIYEFFMYVTRERENQWSARARKLSAIKAFYKYLMQKRRLIEVNPAADIESPKRKQSLPKHLSIDESMSLLDAIESDEISKTKERDYAIITLFLNCGMRLSELVGINLNDMDNELRSLRVIGKGSKERIVYLNDACKSALSDYFKVRLTEKYIEMKIEALFLSNRNQRISDKTVQWLVYKYLGAAGLDYKHYSTHKLRHTAATLMYQTGEVDVRVLKEILGHEQLNTTQIYTHVSDAGMESAVSKNPLAGVGRQKKKKVPAVIPESDGE
jgi:Site-specific recombinase XerD